MSTQQYRYPQSASVTANIPAVGTNLQPIPGSSILIAGENPSLNLQPLQTDANGALIVSPLTTASIVTANQGAANSAANRWPVYLTDGTNNNSFTANGLKVDVQASVLPTGAATESTLAAMSLKLPASLGQHLMAESLSIAIASDQSAIPVSASALPLPSGAATSALQTSGNASLTSIDAKLASLGQKNMAGSEPVVIASDQSAIPISAAALPLPTGAATESTLAAMSAKLPATLGQKVMASSLAIAIASDQSAVPVSAAALPLPSGAATAANQATEITSLASIATNTANIPAKGQAAMSASTPVAIASDQSAVPTSQGGRAQANAPVRNDYTSVAVTTGAFVQLIASTTSIANLLEIFDSSGQVLAIATGAAASEVIQFYIYPGGNGQLSFKIAAGTRISIKAISANATSGQLVMNLYT